MESGESILIIGGLLAVSATGTDGLDLGPGVMMELPLPSSPSGILLSLVEFGFLRSVL